MNKISILVYILLFFFLGCNSDKQEKLYDRAVFCYRSREFYDAIRILEQMNDSKFCEKEKLLGSSY
uniref:hypothetical protein n=1 Tax=Aquimarina sp. I32.4 TaxID=2053903 RepID=UPI001E418F9C